MKRFMAVVLLLFLAASFVGGLLLSQSQAGSCFNRCNPCTCRIDRCCDGVCVDTGRRCPGFCPAIVCE